MNNNLIFITEVFTKKGHNNAICAHVQVKTLKLILGIL